MLTMQPLMLIAEGQDAQGLHHYRVRFDQSGTEVEYSFTVDDSDIVCAKGEDEFVKATFCDPFAPALYQATLKFHKAREVASAAQQDIAKSA